MASTLPQWSILPALPPKAGSWIFLVLAALQHTAVSCLGKTSLPGSPATPTLSPWSLTQVLVSIISTITKLKGISLLPRLCRMFI